MAHGRRRAWRLSHTEDVAVTASGPGTHRPTYPAALVPGGPRTQRPPSPAALKGRADKRSLLEAGFRSAHIVTWILAVDRSWQYRRPLEGSSFVSAAVHGRWVRSGHW